MVDNPAHDGDRLTALMALARVKDAELAEATGRSVQAVGKWQRTGQIGRENLATICRTLHCTSDELLGLSPVGSPARFSIQEAKTPWDAIDRSRMRNAIEWTMEGISQSTSKRSPEATADLVLAVHDMLAESDGQVSRSVVLQMIRSAA